MVFNFPTILTFLRILLIPVLVAAFFLPWGFSRILAAGVFFLAAFTDWLDGYLARRWGQSSPFGAFLDPVADKLMVATALILLVQENPDGLFAIMAAVIVGREITISAVREWLALIGERARVQVVQLGKFKTVVQMTAILLLLYGHPQGEDWWYPAGYWLLATAAVLTLVSMALYLRAAAPILLKREHRGAGDDPSG